jgi:hypothetical protein
VTATERARDLSGAPAESEPPTEPDASSGPGGPDRREGAGWRRRAIRAIRLGAPALLAYVAVRLSGVAALWIWAREQDKDMLLLLARRFDSMWYVSIAGRGYDEGVVRFTADGDAVNSNLAFFPLYPGLMRLVSPLLSVSYSTAGLVISSIASLFAAAGVFAVGNRLYGARAGLMLTVLWGALPHGIVESLAYTEALFTAFAAWSLYAVLRRRWATAGVLCVLAGLTRPTAVALIAAVGVAALYALWRRQDGWWPLLGAALAPLGWLAYVAWVSYRVGRVGGYLDVQAQWGTSFDGGGYTVDVLHDLLVGRRVYLVYIVVAAVLAISVLLLLVARRQPLPLVVYSAAMVVLAVGTAGFYHSKARFLVPAFTLLIPLAIAAARANLRTLICTLVLVVGGSAWFGAYLTIVWTASP